MGFALQSKMFDKYFTDKNLISSENTKRLISTSISMDRITCSTLCMKSGIDCEAFYIKDDQFCKLIKNVDGLFETPLTNSEAVKIYSSKMLRPGKL